jgi:formamidopyrimidine-DNA glycosylase
MLEIPESLNLARQLNERVQGRTIVKAAANSSPHKFTFYNGDPSEYMTLLRGQLIMESQGLGAIVEIKTGEYSITINDGAYPRYYDNVSMTPIKHQLLLELDDCSAIAVTVQMYGGIQAHKNGENDSPFYLGSKNKPQPLSESFDRVYFNSLFQTGWEKLSAKAFLATEQRIPGLGNGVLQDILFNAGIHPKRKMGTLSDSDTDKMFNSVKDTLSEMTRLGGRDTERDLYGNNGGYITKLSKNTVGRPCPVCGSIIEKTAYMGGAVYWCPTCQPL